MDKRKQYSQQTKTAVLAALERNGGNRYQTEKETGVPHSTMSRWIREAEQRGELPLTTGRLVAPEDDDTPLADQLERLVRLMVAVMPQKVRESNLHELTRALTTILATINQARAETEDDEDVYERLAHLMARFSPDGAEDRSIPPPDEASAD